MRGRRGEAAGRHGAAALCAAGGLQLHGDCEGVNANGFNNRHGKHKNQAKGWQRDPGP